MTVESFPGPARYTVSGTGPYAVAFAYTEGAVRVRVWSDDGLTELVQDTDYTVSPAEGEAGDVTLSSAAASAHDGASLYVDRATELEQGWAAAGGAREASLEAQLDRLTQGLQEAKAGLARSLRLNDGTVAPYTPEPGRIPIYDEDKQAFVNGPTTSEIFDARTGAETARDDAQDARRAAKAAKGDAENARDAAEAAYDAFGDRYLGAKANDPTTDNDGDPLETGAIYWNTTSNHWRVWNGSSFEGLDQSARVYKTRADFVAAVSDGLSLPDGWLVAADGIFYKASSGATEISDLPGWVPSGHVYPDHFDDVSGGEVSSNQAMIDAFSYADRVYIPKGKYLIDADFTIPAGKTLVPDGGIIEIADGVTLTRDNDAQIEDTRAQIFSGDGNGSNFDYARPEWWGSIHSTTVPQNEFFAKAINSLRTRGEMLLSAKFYGWDGSLGYLENDKGVSIKAAGKHATTIYNLSSNTSFVRHKTEPGGEVSDIRWVSTVETPTSGVVFMLDGGASAGRNTIKNVEVIGCWEFLNFCSESSASSFINDSSLSNFSVRQVYNRGILIEYAGGLRCYDGNIDAEVGNAPEGILHLRNRVQGCQFSNINLSSGSGAALRITSPDADWPERGVDVRWNNFSQCEFDQCQTGALIDGGSQVDFVNCWFGSHGQLIKDWVDVAGWGVRLKKATRINFTQCEMVNNGRSGLFLDEESSHVTVMSCEIAGNNFNDTNPGGTSNDADVRVAADVSDFTVAHCRIGGGFDWSAQADKGIVVVDGSSDRYNIIYNTFIGHPGGSIDDGGTGTDKDVSTGNRSI